MASDKLFVGLDDGSIFCLTIGSEGKANILRQPDGVAITHMDVDHMQQKLYAVLHKKGILRFEVLLTFFVCSQLLF